MRSEPLVVDSSNFLLRVEAHSGEKIRHCFQCEKCATGCPLAAEMDCTPNQVLQLVQLGDQRVLSSRAIWFCVGCYTCAIRCPNDIDLSAVMDTLRELAIEEDITPALPQARDFHQLFLSEIYRRGRISELMLMARYGLKTRNSLWKRLLLGWTMLVKGRLELRLPRVKQRRRLRALFKEKEKGIS